MNADESRGREVVAKLFQFAQVQQFQINYRERCAKARDCGLELLRGAGNHEVAKFLTQ